MEMVMRPASEAELAEAVRSAPGAIAIRGGGTRAVCMAEGEPLEVSGLSGVVLYDPGALTLVARAGTPLAEVEAVLAAERQRLAFEVPDLRALLRRQGVSTIGGVAAANASGPRRVQVGACRDGLLGVRFIDGRGEVIRNGGRVMKNVTGYDLVKLLAGSHGSLGVLTEVSFRVQAVPETEMTLVSPPLEAGAAVTALAAGLTSPFDVTGAAWDGRAMLRIEGLAGSVDYRAGRLLARLPGWTRIGGAESASLWRDIRDVGALVDVPGALWRISVKPSDGPSVLAAVPGARAVLDWGGGLIWMRVPEGAPDPRRVVAGLGGHATLYTPQQGIPAFQPEAAPVAALTAALRMKFDPRGLLNRGIMG